MAAKQFFIPFPVVAKPTNVGAPGASLYFYAAGTTTKRAIYANADLTAELSNPVVADGAGRFPNIYLDDALDYKLVMTDKAGAALYGADPYIPGEIAGTEALTALQQSADEIETYVEQAEGYIVEAANLIAAIGAAPTSGMSLTANSRTTMASFPLDRGVVLYEAGRQGIFTPNTSDLSAKVSFDTNQGVYVPPATDTTGASGAQVRLNLNGKVALSNFGGALQATVDYSMYGGTSFANAGVNAFVDQQTVNLTDTLHIGYGSSFKSGIVTGLGLDYDGSTANAGTTINSTVTDRPAVNVQGARQSELSGIHLRHSVITPLLQAMSVSTSAALVEANWDAIWTGAGITVGTRYTPKAGITIDGYSGVAPSPAYPSVTYPSFLGAVSQYGKNASSGVRIKANIRGFEVGVAIQPSNVDSNGDFIDLRDCSISYCKYAVSIGNSQARNIDFSRVNITNVYTVVTNNKHGKQIGKVAATINNLFCAGFVYQIFDFNRMTYAGPLKLNGGYAESLFRIGNFTSSSSTCDTLTIENYHFNFALLTDEATAATHIAGDGNDYVDLVNCTFLPPSVVSLFPAKTKLRGGNFIGRYNDPAKPYEAFCSNCLMGGFVMNPLSNLPQEATMRAYNGDVTPPTITGQMFADAGYSYTGRSNCIPHALQAGRCSTQGNWVSKPMILGSIGAASMTSVARTDRAITFTLTSGQMGNVDTAYRSGYMPGCVAVHYPSGTAAFIRSTDTTTRVIIAEMQNNYVKNGSAYDVWEGTDFATGTWYFLNGLVYSPTRMLWGDLVAGSATIINVQSAGGTFDANLGLTVGDMLAGAQYHDQPFTGSNALTISTLTVPAAVTITGVTQANPGVVTATAHGLLTGEIVTIVNVSGMSQLNNNKYKVKVLTADTFSLQDAQGNAVDTTSFGAYTSGGTATPVGGRIVLAGKANFSASHYALPFWYRLAPTNAGSR